MEKKIKLEESSQEHPSLQQVPGVLEGLVGLVVRQVQQCQTVLFHQESPRRAQDRLQNGAG